LFLPILLLDRSLYNSAQIVCQLCIAFFKLARRVLTKGGNDYHLHISKDADCDRSDIDPNYIPSFQGITIVERVRDQDHSFVIGEWKKNGGILAEFISAGLEQFS
jgi:hypothetical protein